MGGVVAGGIGSSYAGVEDEVRHRRQLGGGHRGGLEWQKGGRAGHGVTSRGGMTLGPASPAADAARHRDRVVVSPMGLFLQAAHREAARLRYSGKVA